MRLAAFLGVVRPMEGLRATSTRGEPTPDDEQAAERWRRLYSEDIDETISRDLAVTPLTQTVNYDDFVELTARAREIFDPLSKHG